MIKNLLGIQFLSKQNVCPYGCIEYISQRWERLSAWKSSESPVIIKHGPVQYNYVNLPIYDIPLWNKMIQPFIPQKDFPHWWLWSDGIFMITSWDENIFCITGPLWGEPLATGGFPSQRPVTRGFDVFLDVHLNKRLSKQSRGWWFEMPWRSLWWHCNVILKQAQILKLTFLLYSVKRHCLELHVLWSEEHFFSLNKILFNQLYWIPKMQAKINKVASLWVVTLLW